MFAYGKTQIQIWKIGYEACWLDTFAFDAADKRFTRVSFSRLIFVPTWSSGVCFLASK